MADQTRNAMITALVSLIGTNIAALGTIYDGPEAIAALPEDTLPAMCIVEGQSRVIQNITSIRDIVTRFGLQIFYQDSESTARTFEDALIKLLEANPTISATAILSNVLPSDTPFIWPDNGLKYRGVIFEVRYRQDTP